MRNLEAAAVPVAARFTGHVTGEIESEVIGLFDQHRHGLLRYILSLGLSRQDGEEITQEVFLQLFLHLRLGRPRDNLQGWIFRVGHNLALKQRRLRQRAPLCADTPEQSSAPAAGPETAAADAERRRHLLAAVGALSPRDRRCLALRAEGLHYREIGRVLGISVGSVSNSLTRTVGRLMHIYSSAECPRPSYPGSGPIVRAIRGARPLPTENPSCV